MKHFYYPSAVTACGDDMHNYKASELTCDRDEADCPTCVVQIQKDRETCEGCKLGRFGGGRHNCDPALA